MSGTRENENERWADIIPWDQIVPGARLAAEEIPVLVADGWGQLRFRARVARGAIASIARTAGSQAGKAWMRASDRYHELPIPKRRKLVRKHAPSLCWIALVVCKFLGLLDGDGLLLAILCTAAAWSAMTFIFEVREEVADRAAQKMVPLRAIEGGSEVTVQELILKSVQELGTRMARMEVQQALQLEMQERIAVITATPLPPKEGDRPALRVV